MSHVEVNQLHWVSTPYSHSGAKNNPITIQPLPADAGADVIGDGITSNQHWVNMTVYWKLVCSITDIMYSANG